LDVTSIDARVLRESKSLLTKTLDDERLLEANIEDWYPAPSDPDPEIPEYDDYDLFDDER